MANQFFPAIPNTKTISEKVSIYHTRMQNNYFLNQEPDEIDEEFNEPYIKPIVKITPIKLKQVKSKDFEAKIRKIVWVNEQDEEYASEFKRKFSSNEFTSIASAYNEAQKIYSKYCPTYQKSKATVSSLNGVKQVKRKASEQDDEFFELIETPIQNDHVVCTNTKEMVIETLRSMLFPLREIASITNEELIKRLAKKTQANSFVSSIEDYEEPTTHNQRIADYILATIYEKIDELPFF